MVVTLSSSVPSHTKDSLSRLLSHLCLPFHPRGPCHPLGTQCGECDLKHAADAPIQPVSLPQEVDLSCMTDPSTPPEHLVDSVRRLKPSLPISCELLGPNDLTVAGSYPVDGGGSAEVWVCDGRAAVIKSYRRYSSSSHLLTFLRLYKEARICDHLNGINDGNFVPFLGIYASPDHPFALAFEFMVHLNLKEYLRNNQEIGRVKVLLQVARGLEKMHSHDIIHGNIKISNILVDGDGCARIGGLGTAFVQSTAPTVDVDRFFPGAAPEVADPERWGVTDAGASEASDLYAFGVLAWEVFAGRTPFSDKGVVAGVHLMSNGCRPARPTHPELSDRMWKLIKGCWKVDPAKRKTITEVVAILEAEVNMRK